MSSGTNFFQVGGTLSEDAPSYIERPADEELLAALERRELCLVLAPRQTGKSSLMVHAIANLKKKQGIAAAVVDLQLLGSQTDCDQWFGDIVDQIIRSLKINPDYDEWWRANQHRGPTQRFIAFLEDVVLKEKPGDVVIFFDEIDSVLKLPFSDDFFTTIRSVYNSRTINPTFKRISFVLIGVAAASSFIKDRSRTPFNIGTLITLGDFKKESTDPFQQVLGQDSGQLIDRIFHWTSGQPLLVQQLAAAVYAWPQGERTGERIDNEVSNSYLKRTITHDTHLKFIQDFLLDDSSNIRKTLKLYRDVLQGTSISNDEQSPVHTRLKLAGVVRVEEGRLVPRNQIYEKIFNPEWVDKNYPDNKQKFILYAVAPSIVLFVLGALMIRFFMYPVFPSPTRIVKYTSTPTVDIALEAKNIHSAFVDGREVFISNGGKIFVTLSNLPTGASTYRLSLYGLLNSSFREIPIDVVYYPGWKIHQLPDVQLSAISPLLEINGREFLLKDVTTGTVLRTVKGHTQDVMKVAWSPDRKSLLSLSKDGTIKVWDAETGSLQQTFRDDYGAGFNDAAFAPRGDKIVAASKDNQIYTFFLDAKRYGPRLKYESNKNPDHQVLAVAVSPDDQLIVSGDTGNRIRLTQMQNGEEKRVMEGHRGAVTCLAFSPDGKFLVSGSEDKTVKVWQAQSGRPLHTLRGHEGSITAVAYGLKYTYVLSGSDKGELKLWDLSKPESPLMSDSFAAGSVVRTVSFSPDGQLFYAQSQNGVLKVWSINGLQPLTPFKGYSEAVARVRFSPDGETVVSSDLNGRTVIWNILTGQAMFQQLPSEESPVSDDFSYAPNGKSILLKNKNRLTLIDLDAQKDAQKWTVRPVLPYEVYQTAFIQDGRAIAVLFGNDDIAVWSTDTGQFERTFAGPVHNKPLLFSPNGKLVIGSSKDNRVTLWDVETGRLIYKFEGISANNFSFSPDNKRVLMQDTLGTLKLWDIAAAGFARAYPSGLVSTSFDFSPDNKKILVATSSGNTILDIETGKTIRSFPGEHWKFSPDGNSLVLWGDEPEVKLFDINSGNVLRTFNGHTQPVTAVEFSPDGQKIITASEDKSLKLWWAAFDTLAGT